MSIQLKNVMPDMVRHVDVGRDLIVTKIGDMQSSFSQDICMLAQGLDQLVEQMEQGREKDQFVIGKALGNLSAGMHLLSSAVLETRMVFPGDVSPSCMSSLPNTGLNPGLNPAASTSTSSSPTSTSLPPSTTATAPTTSSEGSSAADRVFAALRHAGEDGENMFRTGGASVPQRGDGTERGGQKEGEGSEAQVFVMERDHQTVEALWREYDVGIFGRLPLKEMIAKDLKKVERQRKRWERRRVVVQEVERLAKERTTAAESVARDMDTFMRREKLSMSKLQDRINAAGKEGDSLPIWTSE
jgi:hypothetical protein